MSTDYEERCRVASMITNIAAFNLMPEVQRPRAARKEIDCCINAISELLEELKALTNKTQKERRKEKDNV